MLEFGDLAESQLTIGQNHQTPTYYRYYQILQGVSSAHQALVPVLLNTHTHSHTPLEVSLKGAEVEQNR